MSIIRQSQLLFQLKLIFDDLPQWETILDRLLLSIDAPTPPAVPHNGLVNMIWEPLGLLLEDTNR